MMSKPSLDEILKDVPSEVLEQHCSDKFLADVAGQVEAWELLTPYFNIDRGEKHSIKASYILYDEQKQEFLFKWKEKNPGRATNRALLKAIYASNDMNLLHNACQLLQHNSYEARDSSSSGANVSPVLLKYQNNLKLKYRAHKPVMMTEWPPPCSLGYVKLVLVPKNKVEKGEITSDYIHAQYYEEMDTSEEVEIEKLLELDEKERKVILFEGPPGSGKSTLLWYICQLWQSGEQFQQYSVVLLVQMRDPAYHNIEANSLVGMVPSDEIASEIQAVNGEGVLLLLDGWDEAPAELCKEDSYFHNLISKPSNFSMEKAVVVVSSRPLAADNIWMHLSHRVELRGFTKEMRNKYIRESLGDDIDGAQSLIDKIDSVKELDAIDVSLPINVVSLIHIFRATGGELPPTPCRIAIQVVLSIIFRNLKKNHSDKIPASIKCFEDLPKPYSEWFHNLCKLAYDGISHEKSAFTPEELLGLNISQIEPRYQGIVKDKGPIEVTTFGLLRPLYSLVAIGSSTKYQFLHLSHQELCAAYYISSLPNNHSGALRRCIHHIRQVHNFHSVSRFYAAITGLKLPGVGKEVDLIYTQINDIVGNEMQGVEIEWHGCEEDEDNVSWDTEEGTFTFPHMGFSRYVAVVSRGMGYLDPFFLALVAETMNTAYLDKVVGEKVQLHFNRATERIFTRLVSMAFSLESVTYFTSCLHPRIFNALNGKQRLKTFVVYVFRLISDCTVLKAMCCSLQTCPKLESVFMRIKFSENVANIHLITDVLKEIFLHDINIDAQGSLQDAEFAALVPAFYKTACVRIKCKEVGKLGLNVLQQMILQSKTLLFFQMTIEHYSGGDRELFQSLHLAPSAHTIVLCCRDRTVLNLYDRDPSLVDSAVGRVLLSGDLVELAEIFGLNTTHTVNKMLHVHIFNSCIEVNLKDCCFKCVSFVECQHKINCMFKKENIEVKNKISLSGVQKLCESLNCIPIQELNLTAHKIGDTCASLFREAIPSATHLQELILRDCNIGEEGIKAIFIGLTNDSTLVTLDVAYNKFGDSGALRLAESVNQTSLKLLDMEECEIGERGVVAIANALRTNTTLEKLSIFSKDEEITANAEMELLKMFLQNKSLSVLRIKQTYDRMPCQPLLYRDSTHRHLKISRESMRCIMQDAYANQQLYCTLKMSTIIASIEIDEDSPLGQALVSDNVEVAANILELNQAPNGKGDLIVHVSNGRKWTVYYNTNSLKRNYRM